MTATCVLPLLLLAAAGTLRWWKATGRCCIGVIMLVSGWAPGAQSMHIGPRRGRDAAPAWRSGDGEQHCGEIGRLLAGMATERDERRQRMGGRFVRLMIDVRMEASPAFSGRAGVGWLVGGRRCPGSRTRRYVASGGGRKRRDYQR